ncbi:serine protease snake-like [Onthophagus taurus]|uniref:serine protease snake-like n=1 Tax=Onthophagus taurus TaxID=166361 RepID=UPI0039BDC923
MFVDVLFVILVAFRLEEVFTKEPCQTKEGVGGSCKIINKCPWAIQQLKKRNSPNVCYFAGVDPVVCCPEEFDSNETKISTEIAKEKCEDYKRTTCLDSDLKFPGSIIVGGTDANPTEFPHMAALGYGDSPNIQWECGGSLISEKFVLTAAHCLISRQSGPLKHVRLGDVNLGGTINNDRFAQQFLVEKVFEYPDYVPFSQYHDIALIELNKFVKCNQYVRPACVNFDNFLPDGTPIATGWGATEYGGRNSDVLQKVSLSYISYRRCGETYRPEPKLKSGIVQDWQICVGGGVEKKDTCQGDSGGPLQVKVQEDPLVYKIVGITSFGKLCAVAPGVYTKVSYYIPWIESVVWSGKNK